MWCVPLAGSLHGERESIIGSTCHEVQFCGWLSLRDLDRNKLGKENGIDEIGIYNRYHGGDYYKGVLNTVAHITVCYYDLIYMGYDELEGL